MHHKKCFLTYAVASGAFLALCVAGNIGMFVTVQLAYDRNISNSKHNANIWKVDKLNWYQLFVLAVFNIMSVFIVFRTLYKRLKAVYKLPNNWQFTHISEFYRLVLRHSIRHLLLYMGMLHIAGMAFRASITESPHHITKFVGRSGFFIYVTNWFIFSFVYDLKKVSDGIDI